MGTGLDDLIESLVNEIAFSGGRVTNLLIAISSFYKPRGEEDECDDDSTASVHDNDVDRQQDVSSKCDLAVASKVWEWLVVRPDVSIGTKREFNHLSLGEVLALPEEEEPSPSEPGVESADKPSSTKTKKRAHPGSTLTTTKDKNSAVRPRLHVSEDRLWRTISGHGPDLKRIPLFEWRALVEIASVKEKGILQGDLVRLSGQDKRSLPTRTDALARKGYIIKQSIALRGGKSSKLWLAQFREDAKQNEEREGLEFDKVDLSKPALTHDLSAVPFATKWSGEAIDYLALAQGFVAIGKAWELIRYCDARAKLGVGERTRQMRALAKTCRWLTNIGSLSFVGAKFIGSNRLFKDCVKYIRDPSSAEWSHFRATPKTRMVVPSGRIGKRGEASRAVHASQQGASGGKATGKSPEDTKSLKDTPHDTASKAPLTRIIPPPWRPQKPLPNSAFDIIKRAGSKGTSNVAICRQTLGHNFRRLTSAMTGSISMPTNSQPSHLKHLGTFSRLSRIGKTMTYTFYANSEIEEAELDEQQQESSSGDKDTATSTSATSDGQNDNMFSKPDLSRFASSTAASLTEITQTQELNRAFSKKRKRLAQDEADDQPLAKKRGRPRGRPRRYPLGNTINDPRLEQAEGHQDHEPGDMASAQPAPRPPGVYRGIPNSLDPVKQRKGRRPKSLVLIFRSDRLKDPSFLGMSSELSGGDSSGHRDEATTTSTAPAIHIQDANPIDASCSTVTQPVAPEAVSAQSKTAASKKKKGLYWCDKCGNSWKNSNGLDYHLTKSQTVCNPNYVSPPAELVNHRKRRPPQRHALNRSPGPRSVSEDHGHQRPANLTPRQQMESRVDGKKRPSSSFPMTTSLLAGSCPDEDTSNTSPQPPAQKGSIILKDLEVYDANDHWRPQRQHIVGTNKGISANNECVSLEDTYDYVQYPVDYPSTSWELHTKVNNHGEGVGPFNDTTEVVINGAEHPGTRRPLPSSPSTKPGDSGFLQADLEGTAVRKPEPSTTQQEPLQTSRSSQPSTDKSLASFARKTKPNATNGARRRNRTFQTIEYLLEQNDGVFPGSRSLFMAVVSVWAKEFRDLAPPDRRVCQNAVHQLERDGILKQMSFAFFDDQAKMHECVVLAKADIGAGPGVDTSDDPRVIAVKEKMREMFPEAYVPDAFSLSPEEAKLFDELASQGREHNQTRSLRAPKDLKKVQNIETLRYEDSVMNEIPIHRSSTKRLADTVQAEVQIPSKRPRLDVEQADTPEKARKTRRRPGKHELWDSGKLAVYIWSQRQNFGATWDQPHSCLQDPKTGTWSWMSENNSSQAGTISTILSSVKSAKDIDASLKKQKDRRAWADIDNNAGNNKKDKYGRQNGREAPVAPVNAIKTNRGGYGKRNTRILRAQTSALSEVDSSDSGEYTDDSYEESSDTSADESAESYTFNTPRSEEVGALPRRRGSSVDARARSTRRTPQQWKEKLPRDIRDILNTARRNPSFKSWADPLYGKFLRDLKTIRKWEQSSGGSRLLSQGTIAPDYIYISLTAGEARANKKPTNLEWLGANQLTPENIPDEVKNTPASDADYGLTYLLLESKVADKKSGSKTTGYRTTGNRGSRLKIMSGKTPNHAQESSESPTQEGGFIEYKTRDLTFIPKQPRGRFNKPAAHDDKLGAKREDELLAACVAFRTLLGGLDRNLDIGLLLKYFPGISLSAIKKFWPRVSRERKSYVEALTKKFQTEFLRAYENDELPYLNYDDIESYDWKGLIAWTLRLETHEDIVLPATLEELEEVYYIEDVDDEAADWRDTWFATTSTYNRIEAVASETMSIPLPLKAQQDNAVFDRARTWVRSICCTSLKGVNTKERLVPKLLELGNGDVAETNRILQKTVEDLNKEKIITRTKGKDSGGNFRLHGMFAKQLEKMASSTKFRQAIAFKAQLDDFFRRGEEFILPYALDDGSTMAMLNMQAYGRINNTPLDVPNIPFGFEPGNYEGRTFPKSYYHFKIRVEPTGEYLYNHDMPLLEHAHEMGPPIQGPDGKIPIWVDFFGQVNTARWADYLGMVISTLALKGPTVPSMCVTLLKPMIEEFEVQLIMDWLDKLGLLQRIITGCGATVAEWWWLVAGDIVLAGDKAREKMEHHAVPDHV